VCHSEASKMRRPWSTGGGGPVAQWGNKNSHSKTTILDRFFQFFKYSTINFIPEMYSIISI
jgi:hypothetical protein